MRVIRVDPRDVTSEVDRPEYRVYFHGDAGASDEHELSDADADQVLAWAEANRRGRSFVVYACIPDPTHDGRAVTAIRLAGHDPNAVRAAGEVEPQPRD